MYTHRLRKLNDAVDAKTSCMIMDLFAPVVGIQIALSRFILYISRNLALKNSIINSLYVCTYFHSYRQWVMISKEKWC